MRSIITSAALLCATTALAACSGSSEGTVADTPTKASSHIIGIDTSLSPATMNDDNVVRAVEARLGENMKRDIRLGDVLTIYQVGSAEASHMVSLPPIITGYGLRLPAAHGKLVGQLHEIEARFHSQGGDDATHLTEALEAIAPDCSSGRNTVTLVTDGIQESRSYSAARALAAGKPVHLSPPPGRYLAGCHKVSFLGFGLTEDGAGKESLLPPRQLAALRQGWLEYLTAAGMRAQDVEFVSAF